MKLGNSLLKQIEKHGLCLVLGLGIFCRILLALFDRSFHYMDEHWQVMEPAGSFIFGKWSQTVEWHEGLRNWTYPWIVSRVMLFCQLLGINDTFFLLVATRLFHAIFGVLSVLFSYRLANFLIKDFEFSNAYKILIPFFAGLFVAVFPFSIYCGVHTHGEMLGAFFVLLAFYFYLQKKYWFTGICLSLAFVLKIDLAVMGLVAGLVTFIHQPKNKKIKISLQLALPAVVFALLIGYVDKITWGTWFHSVLGHARVNLVDEVGNQWGVSPWYWHFYYFLTFVGLPGLVGLLYFLAQPLLKKQLSKNVLIGWLWVIGFILVFSFIAHKEKRFLAPILYIGMVLSVVSFGFVLTTLKNKNLRTGLLSFVGVWFFIHTVVDSNVYLRRQTWKERITALHEAAAIKDSEKFYSPQWPAVFYYPKSIPTETTSNLLESLKQDEGKYKVISLATDSENFELLKQFGFKCEKKYEDPKTKSKALRCKKSA